MFRKYFNQVIAAVTLAVVLTAISSCTQDISITLPDCSAESIEAWIGDRQVLPDEMNAEYLAEHCGADVLLPTLAAVLKNPSFGASAHALAAMTIGKSREPGAEALLISYIEKPRITPIDTPDEFTALSFAMYALGFHGSDQSLAFLDQLCKVTYWQGRDDHQFFDDELTKKNVGGSGYTSRHMRRMAVAGLTASDSPRALEFLRQLRTNGTMNDVASAEWLDECIQGFGHRKERPLPPVVAN